MAIEETKRISKQEAFDLVARFKYVDNHAYKNAIAYIRNIYEWPCGDWYLLEDLKFDERLYNQNMLYRIYYNNFYRYWWQLTAGDI